MYMHTQERK